MLNLEENNSLNLQDLSNDCHKMYNEFMTVVNLANNANYYHFKQELKVNFIKIRTYIDSPYIKSNSRTELLLLFRKQLLFITKNPFFASKGELKNFIQEHFPLEDSLDKKLQMNVIKRLKV